MSDSRAECRGFEEWLLDAGRDAALDESGWAGHVEACAGCRRQWVAHRSLALAFAAEPVPELSPDFDAALEGRLGSTVTVHPLRGWRWAVLLAYAAAAIGVLRWAFRGVPMPTVDPSNPWLALAAFAAVPLTLMMAIAASRWLPTRASGQHV